MGFPGSSAVTQNKKKPCLPIQVQFLPVGWEGPLEKEMATHSSILA